MVLASLRNSTFVPVENFAQRPFVQVATSTFLLRRYPRCTICGRSAVRDSAYVRKT
jgi:hypothetical protein